MSIYLSIVVPLYNEAESVDKLLNRIGTVAVADADPTNPKETTEVTLDGTNSSDADGTPIISYLWEQVPVPTVMLTNAATDTASFTAPDVGAAGATLTFQLTVTDDDGLESTETVNITVHNPTSPDSGGGGWRRRRLFYRHRDDRFSDGVKWQESPQTPQQVRHGELETAYGRQHKPADPKRTARRKAAGDSDYHGCAHLFLCCN